MTRFFEYLFLFAVIVVLQLLLFDNIQVTGYMNIVIYPLFVVLLPVNTKGGILLLSAAAFGAMADVVSGTMGLYSIALILLAFVRKGVLRLFVREEFLENVVVPNSGALERNHFLLYLSVMTCLFFVMVMLLERLTFDYFGFTLLRIVVSSTVSILVMYMLQLPLSKHQSRRSF